MPKADRDKAWEEQARLVANTLAQAGRVKEHFGKRFYDEFKQQGGQPRRIWALNKMRYKYRNQLEEPDYPKPFETRPAVGARKGIA